MINKRFYLTSNQPLKFLKKIMKCAGKTFFKKLEYNGWVYEQVCLAECFKLPTNLLANLLIYRVMCRFYSRI